MKGYKVHMYEVSTRAHVHTKTMEDDREKKLTRMNLSALHAYIKYTQHNSHYK